MRLRELLIAILLAFLVILISYLFSRSIVSIVKERNRAASRSEILENASKETNISSHHFKHFNYSRDKNLTKNYSNEFINIDIQIPKENIKINNEFVFDKFEKVRAYDFCFPEEFLSVEGKNFLCLNEALENITISLERNIVNISYNNKLTREKILEESLLLGYIYAADFYGIEGELEKILTNSTLILTGNLSFGEIKILNQTIVYVFFPIYLKGEKLVQEGEYSEDVFIFTKTRFKNYIVHRFRISFVDKK